MREIKFRAWHKLEKAMLQVGDDYGSKHSLDCVVYFMQGQPVELMQFIGLHDKNKKDIYEGDIITLDDSDIGGGKVTGEVMFNDDQCLSNLEWGLWLSNGYRSTDFLGTLEVIGNIYENPELLKGGEKCST